MQARFDVRRDLAVTLSRAVKRRSLKFGAQGAIGRHLQRGEAILTQWKIEAAQVGQALRIFDGRRISGVTPFEFCGGPERSIGQGGQRVEVLPGAHRRQHAIARRIDRIEITNVG